ncbi:MAG: TrmH family RNA methyltransferase [Acidimicrobiales bacterium]
MEGRQAVRELLATRRRQVSEVWMTEGSDPSPILGEIDRLARDSHVPVRLVSQRRLESVQGTDAPQGVVAFAEPLTAANLDDLVLGWTKTSEATRADAGDESELGAEGIEGIEDIEDIEGIEDIEDIEDDFFIELGESILLDVDPDDETGISSLVESATESWEVAGESDADESQGAARGEETTVMPAGNTEVLVEPGARDPHLSSKTRPSTANSAFLVLLEGVTDPQNLGAILRSAECAGVTGVAVPRHRSVHVTPTVTKAAAGAIEHLQMALVAGMPSALQELGRLGVMTVGLDERGTTSLYDLDLASRPVALVLGSEGSGLSPLSRRRCDVLCKIPVGGVIPSLNVSAAAAVACYEVARQRNREKRA